MEIPQPKDLVILVADRNMQAAMEGLLSRPEALGIRTLEGWDIFTHPERDPGCRLSATEILRPLAHRYHHALVLFDHQGSGGEEKSVEQLQKGVQKRLDQAGWTDRNRAVVIEPELENWLWSPSPEVDQALGWAGRLPSLRNWLEEKGFLDSEATKPHQPKEAVEAALLEIRRPRSSAIYRRLAGAVSFRRCEDPQFQRLVATLREWFGRPPTDSTAPPPA